MDVLTQLLNGSMLAATLRMATPLILGGIGGVFSERAGIMNLGIEGEMLVGACAAAVVGISTGNAWLGVLGALFFGTLMGLLHAFICIRFHANQTVVGTGINIFATGITPWYCRRSTTARRPLRPRLRWFPGRCPCCGIFPSSARCWGPTVR